MKSREEEIKRSANKNFEYLYVLNERKFNEIDEKIRDTFLLSAREREEAKIKIAKEYGVRISKKQINK
ncbi:hypothetical protein, partial [Klebsiella pneumoniae]|uniref:hypothetical protein n=1 Tax=Klebsiella pneumoniae TaxID=573 RepID=UPI0025A0A162